MYEYRSPIMLIGWIFSLRLLHKLYGFPRNEGIVELKTFATLLCAEWLLLMYCINTKATTRISFNLRLQLSYSQNKFTPFNVEVWLVGRTQK